MKNPSITKLSSLHKDANHNIPPHQHIWIAAELTHSSLNLPLSSSSTTSRELLSQFSTCSEWRWLEEGDKLTKIAMYW